MTYIRDLLGSLSNYDDNHKKPIGLMIKTTTLTSTTRLRRETNQFDVLCRTWTYDDEFSRQHLTYWAGPLSLEERKIHFLATFSMPWSLLKVPIKNDSAFIKCCYLVKRRPWLKCVDITGPCGGNTSLWNNINKKIRQLTLNFQLIRSWMDQWPYRLIQPRELSLKQRKVGWYNSK